MRCVLQGSVQRFPADAKERGHFLAAVSGVDQLPGVDDLLRGQLGSASALHASCLGGFDAGRASLGNQAAFQFGPHTNQLPHGAVRREEA
jgi:hypothetical protein